ncbi:MAG: cyclic pyranopterin monophosphate synthase MoaC [Treponema sp.]|jgi:cyclic pyranopterin phosphate synthase|nr:cyclic pyranopterin monophosphate synthase MoaC [Treponema sp.]
MAKKTGGLSHFDGKGGAIMVDISAKETRSRTASAKGIISMNSLAFAAVRDGTVKKGDVLAVARIAGIMAAKKTPDLIPLCHSLAFDSCSVDFVLSEEFLRIEASCTVTLSGKTGAEMEALTGVSAALLTVYDMCKSADRAMVIGDIRLVEKSGGKSGHFTRD